MRDDGSVADLVIVAGMSGAGRSTASATLEDLGWFVIDNVPAALVTRVAALADAAPEDRRRLAVVIGRSGTAEVPEMVSVIRDLRAEGTSIQVLFLDASDEVLIRRYEGTRRRHPLASRGVEESIADERLLLEPVRERADLFIDTGELNTNQLRTRIFDSFGEGRGAEHMQTSVVSFGYKYGIPQDVDLVFDCRFLPNPYWVEELRPFSGLDDKVRDYVLGLPEAQAFLEHVDGLLTPILPSFVREGKTYLTIAMGCTGGRHRSVALAVALSDRLNGEGHPVAVFHRDVDR